MKKLLSTIMALVMLLSLVPMAVTAEGVTEENAVARIGNQYYETLEDAVLEVVNGDTITLLEDVALGDNHLIIGSVDSEQKVLTLDLNGHSISATDRVIMVQNANLTVTGPGKIYETSPNFGAIIIKGSNNDEDEDYTVVNIGAGVELEAWSPIFVTPFKSSGAPYAYGVVVNVNGAKLTGQPDSSGDRGSAIYVNGQIKDQNNAPKLVLNNVTQTAAGTGMYLAGYANTTITGGSITGSNTGIEIRAGELTLKDCALEATAEKFSCEANGNGTTTVGAAIAIEQHTTKQNIAVTINGGSFKGVKALNESNPQANDPAPQVELSIDGGTFIGGISTVDVTGFIKGGAFTDLASAVKYAADGATITLAGNTNGNGVVAAEGQFASKGLTIDFNGHTYSVGGVLVGSAGTGTNAFQLLKGNKITFKNGTIAGVTEGTKPAKDTPNWHGAPAIVIQNYCDLTLDNMTVTGGDETWYTMSNNNGNVIIKDTTINKGGAKGYTSGPVAFDVCRYASYPAVSVTVTGDSVINGDVEVSGKIGEGQSRQLTINSGMFNGEFKVLDKPANITISGGKFSSNPSAYVADKSLEVSKDTADQYTVSKKTNAAETSEVKLPAAMTEGTTKAKIDKGDIDTGKDLTVSSEVASVTINQKGVEAIGNNSDLTLTVKKVDQPNDANKAAYDEAIKGNDTASAIVVDIKLSAGSGNAFTQAVEGAYALVTVKYDASGKADKLKVFYLNGSVKQELTKVNDAANGEVNMFSYDDTNKEITMKLPHFSQYLITTTATTSGGSSVIKTGAGSSAASTTQTVTTDLTPGSITKVTVDGKVVDAKYYTVSGSNVTFTAEFLKTLKNGSHTVTVENATKIAKGVFTVNNPTTAVQAPTTADAGIALYAGMAIASVMGTGVVFTSRKRKNH